MPARPAKKPIIEGWLRQLADGGRLEIFLKVEGTEGVRDRKVRASGPHDEMLELVEWFEEKTGLRVEHPILPKRAPSPIPGSMSLFATDGDGDTSELESDPDA